MEGLLVLVLKSLGPYHLMEVLVQVVRLRLIQTNMDFDGFVVSAVYFQILDLVRLHQYDSEMNGY